MSPHEFQPDDEIRDALNDAVSDVEPRDGLDAIRSRTATTRGNDMNKRRNLIFGTFGAALATAAVILAVVAVGNDDEPTSGPGPAGSVSPSAVESPTTEPTEEPSAPESTSSTEAPGEMKAVPVYYVGTTPQGPRLFREFHRVEVTDPLVSALNEVTDGKPLDPDYRSEWSAGSVAKAAVEGDSIRIDLSDWFAREVSSGRPGADATVALQQMVYTAQAATQTRAPVRFYLSNKPVDEIFGVDTSAPLANADEIETLALVQIDAPAEGATVSGKFAASGRSSSFEATTPWQIRQGDKIVKTGFSTAAGWMDKLYPWKTPVDVSDLAPGDYTFVAMTDDPSGGEGGGPTIDTRSITVK